MAVKSWSVGDVLAAADMNLWTVPIVVIKPSDTTKTSNTTLGNDPDLVLPVAANAVYAISGRIYYDGAANTDMKFAFTIPASTVGYYTPARQQPGGTFVGMFATLWTDATLAANTTGVGTIMTLTAEGLLDTAGTSGNLTFQWAQNNTSGTGSHVKANSYLVAQRIG